MKICTLFILLFTLSLRLDAQWMWHNPVSVEENVLQGQGWPEALKGSYARLPQQAKEAVRSDVWGLSRNSAGVAVHFYSNAPRIKIRYQVTGGYSMPHMPATGVTGVDLYARHMDGDDYWCAAKYSFGDTIVFDYQDIVYNNFHKKGYEYRLYLPLYNSVKWLEIGVPADCYFEFIPRRTEKPIVVYGTSIAQGACASRPGMAWTSILERKLDRPLINFGFSGNGKLEKGMLDFMNEVDAAVYILDCMPNMYQGDDPEELLVAAVKQIREKRPQTPVLITEHSGYTNERTNAKQREAYSETNKAARKAYQRLAQEGVTRLYYLSHEEIGMNMDGMVDGVHPTDWGMVMYAQAYEKVLRNVLQEPLGEDRTMRPVRQRREADGYEWNTRHSRILEMNREDPPKALIIGNSIVNYWGGEPAAPYLYGKKVWEKWMKPEGYRNLGFGWDRIENVLWRVYHGELTGFQADKIVLMIGTNNLESDTDSEIVGGIRFLTQQIRVRQPLAEIKVVGILPRLGMEKRIALINKEIEKAVSPCQVVFVEAGAGLLKPSGEIDESLFRDGLHLNEKGYEKIVRKIK